MTFGKGPHWGLAMHVGVLPCMLGSCQGLAMHVGVLPCMLGPCHACWGLAMNVGVLPCMLGSCHACWGEVWGGSGGGAVCPSCLREGVMAVWGGWVGAQLEAGVEVLGTGEASAVRHFSRDV